MIDIMKAQHDYEWLFLDLDNTILDFNKASYFAFYDAFDKYMISLTPDHYKRYKEINHALWVSLEKGEIKSEDLVVSRWATFIEEYGLKADPEVINNSYFDHLAYNPIYVKGAKENVEKLSARYKLCLVTNGLPEVQIPRLRLTGLDKYFQHIVISDKIGYAKPDKAFFDHCHALTNEPLHDMVLVIGDTLTSDIKGGKDYGYHTCWYNYNGQENNTEYHPDYTVNSHLELSELLLS